MAKGSNPADAHRKAERQKELKKNKEKKKKSAEVAIVKKDTRDLEEQIRAIQRKKANDEEITAAEIRSLPNLRAEFAKIIKAKREYLEEHPDHRRFVFPHGEPSLNEDGTERPVAKRTANLGGKDRSVYNADGTLREPEKSYYYDAVFNPFGNPPPGLPYRAKSPSPEEKAAFQAALDAAAAAAAQEAESSDDGDSDDSIVMPAGPPPAAEDNSSEDDGDSDDSISLPPGPPPAATSSHPDGRPPLPVGAPPPLPWAQPRGRGGPRHGGPPPPPPRGFHQSQGSFPPPPPPMPAGFQAQPYYPPPAPQGQYRPSGPPPRQVDPMLPPGARASAGPRPTISASATISAAPQLRDLQKEATSFVPTAIKRQQQKRKEPEPDAAPVNAAPGQEPSSQDGAGDLKRRKAGLMDALRNAGIGGPPVPPGDG